MVVSAGAKLWRKINPALTHLLEAQITCNSPCLNYWEYQPTVFARFDLHLHQKQFLLLGVITCTVAFGVYTPSEATAMNSSSRTVLEKAGHSAQLTCLPHMVKAIGSKGLVWISNISMFLRPLHLFKGLQVARIYEFQGRRTYGHYNAFWHTMHLGDIQDSIHKLDYIQPLCVKSLLLYIHIIFNIIKI